jgi:thioredoxin 1
MASKNLLEFTDHNFDTEVLKSSIPVLVDFWAEWCGPCRAIAPAITELADQYTGRVKVGKMNVDANMTVPGRYQIMSIPTLLIFKNGQVVDSIVGSGPKSGIEEILKKHL